MEPPHVSPGAVDQVASGTSGSIEVGRYMYGCASVVVGGGDAARGGVWGAEGVGRAAAALLRREARGGRGRGAGGGEGVRAGHRIDGTATGVARREGPGGARAVGVIHDGVVRVRLL